MKQIILYILFVLAFVLTSGTTKEVSVSAGMEKEGYTEAEDLEMPVARPAENPCITVCIAANSYADVSVSQASGFGNNTVRRYRPAGFSFDKLFVYLMAETGTSQVNLYKNSIFYAQDHSALLKSDGYFIYALRRIIV